MLKKFDEMYESVMANVKQSIADKKKNSSPLTQAVEENDLNKVKELVKNGANVKEKDPIVHAVINYDKTKNLEMIDFLLKSGANPMEDFRLGTWTGSILEYATKNNMTDVQALLKSSGAKV